MSELSEAMVVKIIKAGGTVILPGSMRKKKTQSLKDGFKSQLLARRPKKQSLRVVPTPVPG